MSSDRNVEAYLYFLDAWVSIAMARLILIFMPFKKIVRLMGRTNGQPPPPADDHRCKQRASAIGLAVTRASRYSPWRAKCFEQALAALLMLRRRRLQCIIYFGVDKKNNNGELIAHAWLSSNGQIITGGKHTHLYTIVGKFETN